MFRIFYLAAAAAVLPVAALACEGFNVEDAYARSSGAMAQSGAAFMTLHNHGSADCRIVAVRSDIAERVELHTHAEDDQGVMRMIEIEGGIALPAQGSHTLARGGDHVMFLGLTQPLEDGSTIEVTFVFADDDEYTHTVSVDSARSGAGHSHAHGHSHGHSHGD